MGLETEEIFRRILITAKELLKAKEQPDVVILLNESELSIIQIDHDNWNGGIDYFTLYIKVPPIDFVRLQSKNIEEIERQINVALNDTTRSIDGVAFA